MATLTREQILAAAASRNLPREFVPAPEIGDGTGSFCVQAMTGKQRDAWESSLVIRKHGRMRGMRLENMRARLAVQCVIDPDTGERLFTDADAEALGSLPAAVLNRIAAPVGCQRGGSRRVGKVFAGGGWERFTYELALRLGMLREEMIERISSQELSAWLVLFKVQAQEQGDAQLRASSADGQVVISGRDDDDDDVDEDEGADDG